MSNEVKALDVLGRWNANRLKMMNYSESFDATEIVDSREPTFDLTLKEFRDKAYELETEIVNLGVSPKTYARLASEYFPEVERSLILDLFYQSFEMNYSLNAPNKDGDYMVSGWWFVPLVFWTGESATDKEIGAYTFNEAKKIDTYITNNFSKEASVIPTPKVMDSGEFLVLKKPIDLKSVYKKRMPAGSSIKDMNPFFNEHGPHADAKSAVHSVLIPVRVYASSLEMIFFIRDLIGKILNQYVDEKSSEINSELVIGEFSSKQMAVMSGFVSMWSMWSKKMLEESKASYRHFEFQVDRKKGEPVYLSVNYVENGFEGEENEVIIRDAFSSPIEDKYMLSEILEPFIDSDSDLISFSVHNKFNAQSSEHLKIPGVMFSV